VRRQPVAGDRMHIHGTGGQSRRGQRWKGAALALAALVVSLLAVFEGGWQVLVPFGFAALILFVLLCLMRAAGRAAR